jgi:magnesium chelatase family protein
MTIKQLGNYCQLNEVSKNLLKSAMNRLNLFARVYDRILKVSGTICALDGIENILPEHIGVAIQYKSLDREG